MRKSALSVVAVLAAVAAASVASAASLKTCWDDASVAAGNAVPGFVGTTSYSTDLSVGSSVVGTKRCSTVPLPSGLPRNVDLPVTIKQSNALGEVSAASNAVPFQLPALPTVPTGVTVQIVLP